MQATRRATLMLGLGALSAPSLALAQSLSLIHI